MIRVYFDSNVYRLLKKNADNKYQDFIADLNKYRRTLLYCFSHAHCADLKNDKTDKKYEDLDFMEGFVGNNYLSYNALEKATTCYLATPCEAFESLDDAPKLDFRSFFNQDISFGSKEQQEQLSNARKLIFEKEIDWGLPNIDEIPAETKELLSKFLPLDKGKFTLIELMEHFSGFYEELNSDKKLYRQLRGLVDNGINNGKFTVDDESKDFNNELKNTVIKKSFLEFVNQNLNRDGKKEVTNYDFHLQAYSSLDVLGISKDSKGRFRNMFNDGLHSYYGAYCDYVVSDDIGFIKKSKALYKLLNIKTNVVHIDEFIISIDLIANIEEESLKVLGELIIVDVTKGIVTQSWQSIMFDRFTSKIKTFHRYLGFFNEILHLKEPDSDYIVMQNTSGNYSHFVFFKEYEAVTNKVVRILGNDLDGNGNFDMDKEAQEINSQKWRGRHWRIGKIDFLLEINSGTKKFSFTLAIKRN